MISEPDRREPPHDRIHAAAGREFHIASTRELAQEDPDSGSRFTALRKFALWTCVDTAGCVRCSSSVARAMLANPPVLLLDEPTRSLDPLAAARMRATIRSLAQSDGRTVFLTSHNLAEVEELCDRVAIIGKGAIHALDTPAKLRAMHTEEEQVSIGFASLRGGLGALLILLVWWEVSAKNWLPSMVMPVAPLYWSQYSRPPA